MNWVDPWGLSASDGKKKEDTTRAIQIGVGYGSFTIVGYSIEVGALYSPSIGLDAYLTVGVGFGVGHYTKVTGIVNAPQIPESSFHGSSGKTATIGAGLALTVDLDNKEVTGITGIGVGGGISYTKTVTARGAVNDTAKAIKNGIESVKNTVEAVEYITTSYISIMANTIFENMYGQ